MFVFLQQDQVGYDHVYNIPGHILGRGGRVTYGGWVVGGGGDYTSYQGEVL